MMPKQTGVTMTTNNITTGLKLVRNDNAVLRVDEVDDYGKVRLRRLGFGGSVEEVTTYAEVKGGLTNGRYTVTDGLDRHDAIKAMGSERDGKVHMQVRKNPYSRAKAKMWYTLATDKWGGEELTRDEAVKLVTRMETEVAKWVKDN